MAVCTVACRWEPGVATRLLAVRDELVSRDFDGPGEWWPQQPGVVGGRDRRAGGSWCVTDVAAGLTALVLNRAERRIGTPSRGVLPLAAVASGADWPERVDHHDMASFNLVLAGPGAVTVWTWDADQLRRTDLAPGEHIITSAGVDVAEDPKTARFGAPLARDGWLDVLTSTEPEDDRSALVVRHPIGDDVYATVFGQLITSTPGALTIHSSRTPWKREGWVEQSW